MAAAQLHTLPGVCVVVVERGSMSSCGPSARLLLRACPERLFLLLCMCVCAAMLCR